jgi:hypothetical protein
MCVRKQSVYRIGSEINSIQADTPRSDRIWTHLLKLHDHDRPGHAPESGGCPKSQKHKSVSLFKISDGQFLVRYAQICGSYFILVAVTPKYVAVTLFFVRYFIFADRYSTYFENVTSDNFKK